MAVELTVGVPEMVPEDVLKVRPAGNAGSMDHVAITPPELENVMSVMSVPRVRVTVVADAVSAATGSSIVMVIGVDVQPPELFA